MLRSANCCKQLLLLETLTRLDSGNYRSMTTRLLKGSELMYCTVLRICGSQAFHTSFCQRQQSKQKDNEKHNTLIEAKDKPFSALTFGEKGENAEIVGI